MPDAPTLMHCDFCKSAKVRTLPDPDFISKFFVRCMECQSQGPWANSKAEAEAKWNTRSPSPLRELRGWLDKQAKIQPVDDTKLAGMFVRGYATAIKEMHEWLEREGGGGNG